jgi:hypothetical protein
MELNKDFFPLEKIKEGFSKIKSLKLVNIPLKPIEFKGLIGKIHSYTPDLLHLELNGAFKEDLMDLRDYLVQ